MGKKSLLEKAKKVGCKSNAAVNITDEHIELALAWARGEISCIQIIKALGIPPSTIYSFLAFSLRKHIKKQK